MQTKTYDLSLSLDKKEVNSMNYDQRLFGILMHQVLEQIIHKRVESAQVQKFQDKKAQRSLTQPFWNNSRWSFPKALFQNAIS